MPGADCAGDCYDEERQRLTALDTKGFNGGTGTLYIALPNVLIANLPMAYGKNHEPRNRRHRRGPPGHRARGRSALRGVADEYHPRWRRYDTHRHGDLRFNYLVKVKRGIETLAAEYGVRPPDEDDLVAIEFLGGQRVRVTFITEAAAITSLTPLLDQHGNGWGWLPPSVVAPWPDDEEDA